MPTSMSAAGLLTFSWSPGGPWREAQRAVTFLCFSKKNSFLL